MNTFYKLKFVLLLITGLYCEGWANASSLEEEAHSSALYANTLSHAPRDVFIVALKGGGVRGIMQAMILDRIEQETGQKITQIASMMVGTSTGSIITGLALDNGQGQQKYTAQEVVELYRKESAHIFYRSQIQSLINPFGLIGCLYKSSNLNDVLKKYFDDTAFNKTLLPTYITAYDVTRSKRVCFSSEEADDGNLSMRKLIRASCAAPGFFRPKTLRYSNGITRELVDGCMHAINPAKIAYEKAKERFPHDNIHIISIGTGRKSNLLPSSNSKTLGILGWATWVPTELLHTQSKEVHRDLKKELNKDPQNPRYFHLDIQLEKDKGAFDDPSPSNLNYLQSRANDLINNDPVFKQLILKLKEKKG